MDNSRRKVQILGFDENRKKREWKRRGRDEDNDKMGDRWGKAKEKEQVGRIHENTIVTSDIHVLFPTK